MVTHMGNNIDYYRKVRGLTVQQLADSAGMSRNYLNEIKTSEAVQVP